VGEGRRGGQRVSVVHGKPAGARSASSTNPQPERPPNFLDAGAMTEDELARYGQAFKDRAVARLLPPESAPLEVVAREIGLGEATLERWRAEALTTRVRHQPLQVLDLYWSSLRIATTGSLSGRRVRAF